MTGRRLTPDSTHMHGTCIAIGSAGVLILGPPGSGKSDLALRLIDQPGLGTSGKPEAAQLVADDQVVLRRSGNGVLASPPAALAGKLEIRGLGIVGMRYVMDIPLHLVVRLATAANIERLPEPENQHLDILGTVLALTEIDPHLPSAAARVRAALDHFGKG
jgi:HPr kinase/phosphorylase